MDTVRLFPFGRGVVEERVVPISFPSCLVNVTGSSDGTYLTEARALAEYLKNLPRLDDTTSLDNLEENIRELNSGINPIWIGVGCSAAVVMCMCVLVVCFWYARVRKRKKTQNKSDSSEREKSNVNMVIL